MADLSSYIYIAANTVTAANVSATGNVVSNSAVSTTGNVTAGNIVSGGVANITGNITGANLIAGSSGAGNVYAGNVIVNGQPTTYGVANLTTGVVAVQATATGTINNQYASITNGTDISITNGVAKDVTFDTVTASSGIPYSTSTGVFTLTSGVTYRFTGELSFAGYTGYALFTLVDATTNTPINSQIATCPSYNSGFAEANNNTYDAIYTPSTNQTVKFRVTGSSFTGTGVIRGGGWGRINVQQINNAFALNTLDTMSVTGNVSANNFIGNGNTLSNVATKTSGSWTLASGTNTVSVNVPLNGTYTIWVNGNIPNGIVTYTATAVVTNTNVPVLGEQYGWYYEAGNALVLTSIPNQFVGTQGAISNAAPYAGNTANVFTFGITNNSGNTAVVNYGYTKL